LKVSIYFDTAITHISLKSYAELDLV